MTNDLGEFAVNPTEYLTPQARLETFLAEAERPR